MDRIYSVEHEGVGSHEVHRLVREVLGRVNARRKSTPWTLGKINYKSEISIFYVFSPSLKSLFILLECGQGKSLKSYLIMHYSLVDRIKPTVPGRGYGIFPVYSVH